MKTAHEAQALVILNDPSQHLAQRWAMERDNDMGFQELSFIYLTRLLQRSRPATEIDPGTKYCAEMNFFRPKIDWFNYRLIEITYRESNWLQKADTCTQSLFCLQRTSVSILYIQSGIIQRVLFLLWPGLSALTLNYLEKHMKWDVIFSRYGRQATGCAILLHMKDLSSKVYVTKC